MLTIGCHLSFSKGYLSIAKETVKINANTFQFFTRNPRGSSVKELNLADVESFMAYAREHGIHQILAHAPYTLNACSADEHLREFARDTMADDLRRLEFTPGNCYNFHPGSHVKQGVEIGITYIADMLNQILKPEQTTTVLLETMAGKGSEVGKTFEELREILDRVTLSDKMGVCLDTCHVWDGGYDSMNPKGSHKDRHARIGEGHIGKDALIRVVNHPALRHLPFYLETPNDLDGYAREIALMRDHFQK